MIEAPTEFLPLGSVVRLHGSSKTLMVIGRALVFHKDDDTKEFYDYGLCLYPEGVVGDALIYSNQDCVEEVLARGFENDESAEALAKILEILPELDIPRGNPQPADEW